MCGPAAPLLLVLADSLAFHGPHRAEQADDPRLWPNIAAAEPGGRAELVAGIGGTARHALTHDPRVWTLLSHVDALVLGVGGMDTLPSPLPIALRELIPLIRHDRVRRHVRSAYAAAQPGLARAFAGCPGGPVALSPAQTVRFLEQCRQVVLTIRPGIPVVAVLPPVHRAAVYGGVHPGRSAAERATRDWAGSTGVALLDLRALVSEHVLSGEGNPDGMYWGWSGHRLGGAAGAQLLRPALRM